MDSRINCNICPLCNIETDMLCEDNCADMADYREDLRIEILKEIKPKLEEAFNKAMYEYEGVYYPSYWIEALFYDLERGEE